MDVYEKIAAQQQGKENTDVWMVGEQLKEIISREPDAAEIVSRDLDVKEKPEKQKRGQKKRQTS